MESPIVMARDVSKQYVRGRSAITVLDGVSFDIRDGEFVALMGPSGSGKSTLLNLLGGLDRPTRGHVIVNGAQIHDMDRSALTRWRAENIGFVFQSYNLMPALDARSNVELPLLLTALPASLRRKSVAAALELVGLLERQRHKPMELSGGQQQRVAIARAIVSDAPILVCDEPTGNLDRDSAGEILSLLRTLSLEHGKTIVMVTHDPKAATFARRTLHLDKGQLMEAPASLEDRPPHRPRSSIAAPAYR